MLNENQEPEYHNNNIPGILVALVVGGLAGAVAMLLLAPQSGKRTRTQIQQTGIELRDRATEMVEDTITQVRMDSKKIARSGRQKAKQLMHQGQELVTGQLEHVSQVAESGKKVFQGS